MGEATLVADDEETGVLVEMDEVGEDHGLTDDETMECERVADDYLAIERLDDGMASKAVMEQDETTIGIPLDGDVGALRDLVGGERESHDTVGGTDGLTVAVVGHEGLVVGVAHEDGEDVEGGLADGPVALDVAPNALESGDAEVVVGAALDGTREIDEIVGCLGLAACGFLHERTEEGDVLIGVVHDRDDCKKMF